MSESSPPKKSTRTPRTDNPEAETNPENTENSSAPQAKEDSKDSHSGPVRGVRDARTNPPAEDEESPPEKPSRRADEARKEANHTPDEIPATIEGKDENPTISDPSDNSDRENDRNSGRNRKGRGGRERGGRNKPREDRDNNGGGNNLEVDPDRIKDMAWEIYKSEVCEEGLALLDPRSMREYARSSFRAARIFLEEEQEQN